MRNGDRYRLPKHPYFPEFVQMLYRNSNRGKKIRFRHSSSAPLRGHLPPGGRYCAACLNIILYLISRILYLGSLRLRRRETARVGPQHYLISYILYLISHISTGSPLRGGRLLIGTKMPRLLSVPGKRRRKQAGLCFYQERALRHRRVRKLREVASRGWGTGAGAKKEESGSFSTGKGPE